MIQRIKRVKDHIRIMSSDQTFLDDHYVSDQTKP